MPDEYLFEETMKEAAGFLTAGERGVRVTEAQRAAVQDLVYNSMYQGQRIGPARRAMMIEEALTTSDFPLMFGDVLDRQLLAAYKGVEAAWRPFTKLSTVRDFRDAYRFSTYGGDNLLPDVTEKGEYLASPRSELRYTIAVTKRGRQFDISWESMINDDLGALRDTPERFGRAAERTEHRIITALYASDVGAHVEGAGGNLYAVGINCVASGTGLLTIANLEIGVQNMNTRTDIGGEPIMATPKYLVVGPALEFTALQILTSANKMWLAGATTIAGAPDVAVPTRNVIADKGLILIVDKYLPVVNAGANDQDTQWYLFSDPADIVALEAAHLSGHENPEIAMKNSDKVSVGGGPISPFDGDFATDNVFYRVRHVFGGAKRDWRGTYMGGYIT